MKMNKALRNDDLRRRVIYLDMDGVIADFDGYIIRQLGKPFRKLGSSQEAWQAVRPYTHELYAVLEPMPDAETLVNGVIELANVHDYDIGILTAVPKLHRVPMAKTHKIEWLRRHFPMLLNNFNIGPWAEHKQYHCLPGDVLIDDSTMNIPQWNDRGGVGILHVSATDSLKLLRKALHK